MSPRNNNIRLPPIFPFLLLMLALAVVLLFPGHALEEVAPSDEIVPDESYTVPADDENKNNPDESTYPSSDEEGPSQAVIDYYSDTISDSDVVVDRADLHELVSLVNDLSAQLSLYAANNPSLADLTYRDSLLQTLTSISQSLEKLTSDPDPEEQEQQAQQEQADRETVESIRDSLVLLTAPPEESEGTDTSEEQPESDPGEEPPSPEEAEPEEEPSESSPDEPTEETSETSSEEPTEPEQPTITEQQFYQLVLGLLLCILLVPILRWIITFIKSFFPV